MTLFWVVFNIFWNIIDINGLTFVTHPGCGNGNSCLTGNTNMFDISATGGKDIRITGLKIKCDIGIKTVFVYRCMPTGGYSSYIESPGQWALEAQRQVNCNGFNNWTDIGGLNVFILNLFKIGFTIHIPTFNNPLGLCFWILYFRIFYKSITIEYVNNMDTSNSDITVHAGIAFPDTSNPFGFNSDIYASPRLPIIEVSYEIADSMCIHVSFHA